MDLARCACVCRSWKVLTQSNTLWSKVSYWYCVLIGAMVTFCNYCWVAFNMMGHSKFSIFLRHKNLLFAD